MNKFYQDKWIAALESSRYRPHRTLLHHSNTGRMNAEGVLCDVLVNLGYNGIRWHYSENNEQVAINYKSVLWYSLPESIQKLLGIDQHDLFVLTTLHNRVTQKTKTFPYEIIEFVRNM